MNVKRHRKGVVCSLRSEIPHNTGNVENIIFKRKKSVAGQEVADGNREPMLM